MAFLTRPPLPGDLQAQRKEPGDYAACFRRYRSQRFSLDGVEDVAEQAVEPPPLSLAKNLAPVAEESAAAVQRRQSKSLTRMKRKRLAELRTKKRVKEQYLNGKFYGVMDKIVANAETLEDAYDDIVRLNPKVDLASAKDDVCFVTLAEQLSGGEFDVRGNAFSVVGRDNEKDTLFFLG